MAEKKGDGANVLKKKQGATSTPALLPQPVHIAATSSLQPFVTAQPAIAGTGFKLRPQIISTPFGLRIADNTVTLPIQQASTQVILLF